MNLEVLRETKDGLLIKGDSLGLVIAFQNVTADDHNKLDELLKNYMLQEPVAIYYDWKMVSVFIFDLNKEQYSEDGWKRIKTELQNTITNKYKYVMVANGVKESGSQVNQIQVGETKNHQSFSIRKSFQILLDMSLDTVPTE